MIEPDWPWFALFLIPMIVSQVLIEVAVNRARADCVHAQWLRVQAGPWGGVTWDDLGRQRQDSADPVRQTLDRIAGATAIGFTVVSSLVWGRTAEHSHVPLWLYSVIAVALSGLLAIIGWVVLSAIASFIIGFVPAMSTGSEWWPYWCESCNAFGAHARCYTCMGVASDVHPIQAVLNRQRARRAARGNARGQ